MIIKTLFHEWKTGIDIVSFGGKIEWFVKGKKYKTKRWFQKAAKLYDDDMLMLILKYGSDLK